MFTFHVLFCTLAHKLSQTFLKGSLENRFYFTVITQRLGGIFLAIGHVLNEQGTGYEHIFFLVRIFNID